MTTDNITHEVHSPTIPKEKSAAWEGVKAAVYKAVILFLSFSFVELLLDYRLFKRGNKHDNNWFGQGNQSNDKKPTSIVTLVEGLLIATFSFISGANAWDNTKKHNEEVRAMRRHAAQHMKHVSKHDDLTSTNVKHTHPATSWHEYTSAAAPDVAHHSYGQGH